MVWKYVWGCRRDTYVPIVVKTVNQHIYKQLLKNVVSAVYLNVKNPIEDALFMQDNAPVNTASIPVMYIAPKCWNVMKWPPYSPDLYPIKHVQKKLKELLQKNYAEVATIPGGPKTIKAKLAELLPKCGDMIQEDYLEKLWKSMSANVKAVRKVNGWYTTY